MIHIIDNLQINEEKMRDNIKLTQGRTMSEAIMMALANAGMNRQEAHKHLRILALKSETEKQPLERILLGDNIVRETLSEGDIRKALNPQNYLGTAVKQIESVIEKTRRERKTRGLAD